MPADQICFSFGIRRKSLICNEQYQGNLAYKHFLSRVVSGGYVPVNEHAWERHILLLFPSGRTRPEPLIHAQSFHQDKLAVARQESGKAGLLNPKDGHDP